MINSTPSDRPSRRNIRGLCRAAFFTFALSAVLSGADTAKKNYNLPAGDAGEVLKAFTAQSGEQIVYPVEQMRGIKTKAVRGELSARAALEQMLTDTGLVIVQDEKTGALAVKRDPDPNAARVAQTEAATPKNQDQGKVEEGKLVLDTFEVMGRKLLNMDKPRSRDDAQPYVVFDRTAIERSGATNLEDFFRQRVPMETTQTSESQRETQVGSRSTINLRGLGANQTLILIDGHRTGGAAFSVFMLQADLNGIPLGAVERIEILPTTASGIYGGSATGGVVNIILRRDYSGMEVKLTYDNTFRSDSAKRRVDLSAGLTLEDGKTNIIMSASYSDGNSLLSRDRDFLRRGRANISANNFAFYNAFNSFGPIGYTTNIRSVTAANLTLKPAFGGTVLNSTITYIPVGYAGPASDNAAALVANSGKYNLDGADSAAGWPGALNRALLNTPEIESASATIRRQFNPKVQAFLELSGSNNTGHFVSGPQLGFFTLAATAPNNPFVQSIRVAVPVLGVDSEFYTVSKNRRAVAGIITKLAADWQASLDLTYERSSFAGGFPQQQFAASNAAVGNGTLDVMRDVNLVSLDWTPYYSLGQAQAPIVTEVKVGTLRAGGPVGNLPAGRATINTYIERRQDVLNDSIYAGFIFQPKRTQTVNSAYLEAKVPLISVQNKVPFVHQLELQLAGRIDDYTTEGANSPFSAAEIARATSKLRSTDPTVGLRYLPVPDMMLRASYGTGFLPPDVSQLVPRNLAFPAINLYTDPRRGNEFVGAFTNISGGNAALTPELSETWSAGLVLTPHGIPSLRFSVDWVKISKRDNILAALDPITLLANEANLPGRVIRGPNLPGDPAGYAGRVTALDLTLINLSRGETEAFDFALDYDLKTQGAGTFSLFAIATRTLHFKTQLLPSSPLVENVGTVGNAGAITGPNYPLKFKGNFGVNWKYGRWSAGWTARYYDSYSIYAPSLAPTNALAIATALAQGNGARVPSQIYHDVVVGYRFGPTASTDSRLPALGAKLLNRTEVQIGVRNLFNTEPPFDVTGPTYYSGFGDPRISSYYISVKKAF
jgi:outer membrane receptor protein involved in Fe transport